MKVVSGYEFCVPLSMGVMWVWGVRTVRWVEIGYGCCRQCVNVWQGSFFGGVLQA